MEGEFNRHQRRHQSKALRQLIQKFKASHPFSCLCKPTLKPAVVTGDHVSYVEVSGGPRRYCFRTQVDLFAFIAQYPDDIIIGI